ncbi:MAG: SGNH/GDSL hydrolase family protein [Gammaproteobacteria bacterium]|nr:SGNH/GDSL hydrolase family protein [Gammaproteobacteria bacterium]
MNTSTTPRRTLVFYLIALSLPLLLLGALELGLRVVGFGNSYPLFIEVANVPGYMQANPDVIKRYFPTPEMATKVQIDPIYFKSRKDPETLRIVVQGGSSAAGYPYGRWGGLAGMLQSQLELAYPDKRIEVITTAMSAVNSYTMLDFADEIAAIEPDAVLIYAGHNEYVGVFGAASALTPVKSEGANLLYLKLRELRLFQLMQHLYAVSVIDAEPDIDNKNRGTLMAKAALSQRIAMDSESYQRGIDQFTANIGMLLETYKEQGIPVWIGTVVSNLRHQPPFESAEIEQVDAELQQRWQQTWATYQQALSTQDAAAALATLRPLGADFDGSATLWYAIGQQADSLGDLALAKEAYIKAKDRDLLRFRAPEAINQAIRSLASNHRATLVDVEAAFVGQAPGGIIGDELILEHLHPNADGYFLLADSYYQALRQSPLLTGMPSTNPDFDSRKALMPITVVDQLIARHKINVLKADYPFRAQRVAVEYPTPRMPLQQIAKDRYEDKLNWLQAMNAMLAYYQQANQLQNGLVVAHMVAQAMPHNEGANLSAGMLFMFSGQNALARRYLREALSINITNGQAWVGVGYAEAGLGNIREAREALERAVRNGVPEGTLAELAQTIRQAELKQSE